MRQPSKFRNLCLMAFGACLLCLLAAFVIPEDTITKDWRVGLFAIGIVGGVLFLVVALMAAADARLYDRMMAGEGVLDRWPVSADLWQRFLASEPRRAELTREYSSCVYKYKEAWPEMEVVVGEKAIIVGTDFHRMPTKYNDKSLMSCNIIVDGGINYAELLICTVYTSKHGLKRIYEAVRFPVHEDHVQSMLDVLKIYHGDAVAKAQMKGLLFRYPRAFRNVSLVIVVVCAIAFGMGFYSNRNPGVLLSQPADVLAAIFGALLGVAFLILLSIAQFALAKQKSQTS